MVKRRQSGKGRVSSERVFVSSVMDDAGGSG